MNCDLSPKRHCPGRTILLVGPRSPTLSALKAELSKELAQVSVADSGLEALGCIEKTSFDMVVSELPDPGFGGSVSLRLVRPARGRTGTPVGPPKEARVRSFIAGTVANLAGPVELDWVVRAIDSMLE